MPGKRSATSAASAASATSTASAPTSGGSRASKPSPVRSSSLPSPSSHSAEPKESKRLKTMPTEPTEPTKPMEPIKSPTPPKDLETYCINVVRMLAADLPSAAQSGHPGAPMGCAPMTHVLYGKLMQYNPRNPQWSNRDRFVLSNGHACALQYAMLHVAGYEVTLRDLQTFRQLGSKCPGHPENTVTPGVELTTGPLGQGVSNAVGLAIAEKHLAAKFNRPQFKVVDHYTYAIAGDGCLQEGVSGETASLAGHLGLGKLIVLYDANQITIDGTTSISFTENVLQRYKAYGWHTQVVENGRTDYHAIEQAILNAKGVKDQPSIIEIHTIIGFGSSVENTPKAHGAPLSEADLIATKDKFQVSRAKFYVPPKVYEFYNHQKKGQAEENSWKALFQAYEKQYPDLAAEYRRQERGEFPKGWKEKLPIYTPQDPPLALRKASEIALNAIGSAFPELIGGSADLTSSNLTHLKGSTDFQKATPEGRYLRFGIREHGMAAICNGIFAHGLLRPFCATFLNFVSYALGAVRLSALSNFGVLYIATHDSILLGEDGPTHQPIEMLPSLRTIPNMYVYRPADGNEVSGTYLAAMEYGQYKPSTMVFSRSNVPQLIGTSATKVLQGAYTLGTYEHGKRCKGEAKTKNLALILIATGTEVNLAIQGVQLYTKPGKIRIVSMPCQELFREQSVEYQQSILGTNVPVISIEAASTMGWKEFSHLQIGIDTFGASGPPKDVEKLFHFTPKDILHAIESLLDFYAKQKQKGILPHDLVTGPTVPWKNPAMH